MSVAKHSRRDAHGKLFVDCAECGRGGCYIGSLRAGLTVPR
jgi:hypothetical protein